MMTKRILASPLALPTVASHHPAAQALRHMRALLPSYREVCGAAPYYYAAGEIQRLEGQLIQIHMSEALEPLTRHIETQLESLAYAIREGKGRGIDLDA